VRPANEGAARTGEGRFWHKKKYYASRYGSMGYIGAAFFASMLAFHEDSVLPPH